MRKKILCAFIALITIACFVGSTTIKAYAVSDALTPDLLTGDYSSFGAASAIVLVDGENVVLKTATGFADVASGDAATIDNVYLLGDMSTIFVWLSIMQLYEEGKLELNDDISKYLPDGYLKSAVHTITIENLMANSGGFEDYLRCDMFVDADSDEEFLDKYDLTSLVKKIMPRQAFKPGKVRTSSKYEASLAAVIVENVSGMSYVEYVNEHILNPLEMESTSVASYAIDKPELRDRIVTAYGFALNGYTVETQDMMYSTLYPSYGAYSTIGDLTKLLQALMQKSSKLFASGSTYDKLLEPVYSVGKDLCVITHGLNRIDGKEEAFGYNGSSRYGRFSFAFSYKTGKGYAAITNEGASYMFTLADLAHSYYFGERTDYLTGDESPLPVVDDILGEYAAADELCYGYKAFAECMRGRMTISLMQPANDVTRSAYFYASHYDINRAFISTSHFKEIKQIEPNRFIIGNAVDSNILCVEKDEDGTLKVFFDGDEYIQIPWYRSIAVSNASIVLTYLMIAFAIVSVALVAWYGVKNRTNYIPALGTSRLIAPLTGIYACLILNNAILLIVTYATQLYSSCQVHFVINYILSALAVLTIIGMILLWKKSELIKRQKLGYISMMAVTVFTIVFMVFWNLYS